MRIGPAVIGDVELDALHLGFGIEHGGPGPTGNRHVDCVVLGGNRHHLGAAPGHRAHILVAAAIQFHNLGLGGIKLLDGVGDYEIHDLSGFVQAQRMFARFENGAGIGAFAFKNG